METVISPLVEGAALAAEIASSSPALPAEWSTWAEEPGQRLSLRDGDRLLGTVHLVMVGRDEAWVEGLWVEPSVRRRGIARRLIGEAHAVAARYGATLLRTAVPVHNGVAGALARGTGFARRTDARVAIADLPKRPSAGSSGADITPTRPGDVSAIVALAGTSRLASWQGLIPLGWRFRQLRPELVRGLIKDARVLRAGGAGGGAAAFALRGGDAVIAFLDGDRAQRQALYEGVATRARAAGARRLALFMPDAEGVSGLDAVFHPHPWCPDGLVILERRVGPAASH